MAAGALMRGMVLLGAAVLTGCGGGPEDVAEESLASKCERPAAVASKAPEGVNTCIAQATVTVDASGAESIDDSGRRRISSVEFHGGALPEASWFIAFQIVEPVPLGEEGTTYRVGFQTPAGGYRGPGTYTLPARAAGEQPSPSHGEAYLEVVKPSTETKYVRYARSQEPCAIEVGKLGLEGELECPALAADTGGEVTLKVRWTAA